METITVATWNTQGNAFADGKINHLIGTYDPDIICLQECGNLAATSVVFPGRPSGSRIICGTFRPDAYGSIEYNVFYYPWRGGCRCSMAVMTKSGFRVAGSSLVDFHGNDDGGDADDPVSETTGGRDDEGHMEERTGLRAMMRVNIEHMGDEISINNVHLPAGRPAFARKVGYALIDDCFNKCPRNIVIAGDMNTLPDSWRQPHSRRISAPDSLTHECGGTLDYMFTNMHVLHVDVDDGFRSSDHLAVLYEMQLTC